MGEKDEIPTDSQIMQDEIIALINRIDTLNGKYGEMIFDPRCQPVLAQINIARAILVAAKLQLQE